MGGRSLAVALLSREVDDERDSASPDDGPAADRALPGALVSFNPREWHHSYLGALMLLVGWLVGAWWCCWLGVLLVADDVLEHTTGIGPLLWLYGHTLYRLACVRRLNVWLDRQFGK